MRIIFLGLIVTLILSCAHIPGEKITDGNNTIIAKSYYLTFPFDSSNTLQNLEGWLLQQNDDSSDIVDIIRKTGAFRIQITAQPNILNIENEESLTPEVIANDFRNYEIQNMMINGVSIGMYELGDVEQYEKIIHEKTFYVLSYTTFTKQVVIESLLYLYFPNKNDPRDFFMFQYTESIQRSLYSKGDYLAIETFHELISSIKINEHSD